MNWESRIIAEFAPCSSDLAGQRLPEMIGRLIEQQKREWPLLAQGYAAFEQRQTKTLTCPDDPYILVQFNPGRIRSTAAQVDKASIESRPCFLCPANLPPEEKGIAYGPDLVIACNPFPVLNRHLSIIDRNHVPQRIDRRIDSLLTLSADLGPEYFTLYNGPECGASAPDHFHLQACAREGLPIDEQFHGTQQGSGAQGESFVRDSVEISLFVSCGRSVVAFSGAEMGPITAAMSGVITGLGRITGKAPEPMINIVAFYDPGRWTVFLFPRARHRPESYFKEGDEKLIVSPGAIDMAGVIVTPRLEDFERITAVQAASIFSEVSLDLTGVRLAVNSIR